MFSWINALIDRGFAVAGALLFLQIPLFMQDYTLQLSGREAELRYQVNAMQQVASQTGKTIHEYIQKFLQSGDQDFTNQGVIMQDIVNRLHAFTEALQALQNNAAFTRPYVFISHLDYEIAASTWSSFEFGISLTMEGGAYALAGLCFGFVVYFILRKGFQLFRKKGKVQMEEKRG